MTAPLKITAKAKFELANEIRSDKTLSLGDRMVGLYLVEQFNPRRGFAYPTRIQIAAKVGISARSVQRSIKKLEGRYFAIKRASRNGHANEYRPIMGGRMSPLMKKKDGRQRRPRRETFATKMGDTSVSPNLNQTLTNLNGKNKNLESEKASKPATGHKPKSLTKAVCGKEIDEAEAETYLTAFEGLPPEERLTLLKSPMENQKLKLLAHHAGKAESRKCAQELLAQIAEGG
jgi:hypothetical protein